ncbi:ATP-binding protein [Micromonospora craterilacus]|uniref:ATP-binding protein n=1 Tax=Micromonospora craterilacus TaxID=1655439 RepID=A0A2W2D5E9_9ACTN|nr:ATP-binding protein [Micromonospora craterilacus]PZG06083.1 ATP-binding protein [Micromonospora craterilacus]
MDDDLTQPGGEPTPGDANPPAQQPRRREPIDAAAFRRQQAADYLAARVPAVFADACPDNPRVAAWVSRYLNNPAGCPSLTLIGPTGRGKTHQLWGAVRAIVTEAAGKGRRLNWQVVTHPGLNASTRPGADDPGLLARCMSADLLAVDDIGAGKFTDWGEDVLLRLVDHRWSGGLPTIYSTNLAGDPLVKAVGARVESRIADAVMVAFEGPDRRTRRSA